PGELQDPGAWCSQGISFTETPSTSGHFAAQSTFSCAGGSDYAYVDVAAYTTDDSHRNLHVINQSSNEDFAQVLLETDRIPSNIQRQPNQVLLMDSLTM